MSIHTSASGMTTGSINITSDNTLLTTAVTASPIPVPETDGSEYDTEPIVMPEDTPEDAPAPISEVVRIDAELLSEMKGKYPDVPYFAGVDIALLTKGDSDPMFLVLPIARVGMQSRNGYIYDEFLVGEIERQLPGKGGLRGHLREDERSSAFPLEVVHWVGSLRVGDLLWAKAYVAPGETRNYVREVKARGGGLSTSIYGEGTVVETGGARRLTALSLESVDIVPPQRASLQLGGDFTLVAEMEQGRKPMDLEQIKAALGSIAAADLIDMIGDERMTEVTEAYMKRKGRKMVAAEMVRDAEGNALRVAELEVKIGQKDTRIVELESVVRDFQMKAFETTLDTIVAEAIDWKTPTESAQEALSSMRAVLRNHIVSELKGQTDERRARVIAEQAMAGHVGMLARTTSIALQGGNAVAGAREPEKNVFQKALDNADAIKQKWGV